MEKIKIFFTVALVTILFGLILSGLNALVQPIAENNLDWNSEFQTPNAIQSAPHSTSIFSIRGTSMLPTLENGQRVKADWNYYLENEIQRNDLIMVGFKTRTDLFAKRVIAVEGDSVEFKNGEIELNGEKLIEPYLFNEKIHFVPEQTALLEKQLAYYNHILPSQTALVLGDNREASFDGFDFGLLPYSNVKGKIIEIMEK